MRRRCDQRYQICPSRLSGRPFRPGRKVCSPHAELALSCSHRLVPHAGASVAQPLDPLLKAHCTVRMSSDLADDVDLPCGLAALQSHSDSSPRDDASLLGMVSWEAERLTGTGETSSRIADQGSTERQRRKRGNARKQTDAGRGKQYSSQSAFVYDDCQG